MISIIKLFRWLHWWLPVTRTRFTGELRHRTIILDHVEIVNASFHDCDIMYGGGAFKSEDVHFERCSWSFFGSAANTLVLMQFLHDSDPQFVAKTFGCKP